MNLSSIIELSAATLGLFSAVFFCVGVLHVKESTLEQIATLMWGKGVAIATELAQQKSDFIFGSILLFLSFFVQVAGKCLPSSVALSVVDTSTFHGFAVGLAGPVVLLSLLYVPYRHHRANIVRKLMAAVEGKV